MPCYQDPGHNGQHAFTAFIHHYSPFIRFSLAPCFDPAQCENVTRYGDRQSQLMVARVEMSGGGGGGGGNAYYAQLRIGRKVGPPIGVSGKGLGARAQYCQKNVAHI
jgi:hypothetical protein